VFVGQNYGAAKPKFKDDKSREKSQVSPDERPPRRRGTLAFIRGSLHNFSHRRNKVQRLANCLFYIGNSALAKQLAIRLGACVRLYGCVLMVQMGQEG